MEKNYLTKDNGCQIVEASSEAEKAAACNILRAETNVVRL